LLTRPEYKRNDVWPIIYEQFFLQFKAKFPQIKINIVGSIRREKQIIHDFDLIIASKDNEIKEWCCEKIEQTYNFNLDKFDGFFKKIPIQIWFCDETEYGPYLLMKTGPLYFNQKLASIAKRKGLTLSEKGLFIGTPDNKGKRIDENTEASITWILLGCKWIHPKER
jgi:DNA polymerase/3'-5' exonuclease PolX